MYLESNETNICNVLYAHSARASFGFRCFNQSFKFFQRFTVFLIFWGIIAHILGPRNLTGCHSLLVLYFPSWTGQSNKGDYSMTLESHILASLFQLISCFFLISVTRTCRFLWCIVTELLSYSSSLKDGFLFLFTSRNACSCILSILLFSALLWNIQIKGQ